MLPLDYTFCSGSRCARANSCQRWTKNLYEEAERKKISLEKKQISVAEFSGPDDHGMHCGHYITKEEPAKAGTSVCQHGTPTDRTCYFCHQGSGLSNT
jgi:hypothetical protein